MANTLIAVAMAKYLPKVPTYLSATRSEKICSPLVNPLLSYWEI